MHVEVQRPLIRTQNHGTSTPPQDETPLSWPEVLGRMSGIMRGIALEAGLALEHPLTEENVAVSYSKTLLRIESEARRAEELYTRWANRELPEHKDL
jgi:hypothetical protein